MKGMKRFVAALLAAVIVVASVPAMKTEAALAIKGKFVQWGIRKVTAYGQTFDTYDCAVSYVGIDASYKPSKFEYKVYTQDGSRELRHGFSNPVRSRDDKYYMAKVEGGRRTVLTSVRIRALIGGKWSAWTGLIGLIPIHTPDYVKLQGNAGSRTETISWSKFNGMKDYEVYVSTSLTGGWKMVTRTTGSQYTIKNFNGSALKKGTTYYVKVIGRAAIGSTVARAKGDSDSWYVASFSFY